ncbi:Mtr2p KNAG_0D04530 [Huiozyma naganishii CBS 8797]|uniref:SnoaL-like domain-containing protein n=1 Tax=Huiozyma naganishii (strain ATCC MYA-139 / BCRC 22969 / CBS 8797 / KCTC 17520 / NBRC 10181 / NCYC 3082 / Yp74L-3) TaxID=1071383 RepID=J7RL20_HUIN7|nr:hypothetical protein KNAG_0D04530 [Kazachstania naganishii CBS 8797]CCK70198.1 hypothetical protein KNAG_0D04530 [Kazachstania naganishii CBS 8797]
MNQQGAITDTFVKKVFAHLDNTDVNKLGDFLSLFQSGSAKIILNSQPFGDPTQFLTLWQQQVVATQHTVQSVDFHLIPGSGMVVCNVTAKVRFDESGRDKAGVDATIRDANGSGATPRRGAGNHTPRTQWGPYFGISLQLVLNESIYRNSFQGCINAFNYSIVYKPSDTLMQV